MTFLELCEYTFERVNRHPAAFTSVDLGKNSTGWIVDDPDQRAVIRLVGDAYAFILGLSRHWSFFRRSGKLLDLVAGKAEYSPGRFDSIVWNSLYVRQGNSRIPIYEISYDLYLVMQAASAPPQGTSIALAIDPSDNWHLYPTPKTSMELWGEGVLKPTLLETNDDSPPWDEGQHRLVGDLAARLWELEVDTKDELITRLNAEAIGIALTQRLLGLVRKYTEGFG